MKQLTVLPLVAIISGLMVGCGGGGGGGGGAPTPAPKYTWQMINLYATDESKVAKGCVIYAEQDGHPGKVISAKVADRGFKILYHNADGSVIAENTIDSIASTGKVTIDSGKVPANGYVSVEELDGTIGGSQDVYMFAVQKDFLRNMVVNVRQAQSAGNVCYKEEQNTTIEHSESAAITVAQAQDTKYYQTSFINQAVSGLELATNIPVKAPLETNKKVLVTAFSEYSVPTYSDLKHFVFVDGSAIYDSTNPPESVPTPFMQQVDVSDVNFKVTGVNLEQGSAVTVGFANEMYQWQPIYSSTQTLSYTTSNLSANGWSVKLYGNTEFGAWEYHSLNAFNGSDVNLDSPQASSFSSSVISSSCDSAEYCLSADGFNESDFDIQRTHLRSTTSNNSRNFYQSIFAKPNRNQVFMESSEEMLVPNANSDRIEVGVGSLDVKDGDAVMYFLEKNVDFQNMVTSSAPNFSDVNGSVSVRSEINSRQIKLLSQNVIILENGKN